MKIHDLTLDQWDVAQLVADGFTDAEIAEKRGTEEQTVRFHIWRIAIAWNLRKQGNTRAQIAAKATAYRLNTAA